MEYLYLMMKPEREIFFWGVEGLQFSAYFEAFLANFAEGYFNGVYKCLQFMMT
jgi:hypothetical protein